MKQIREHMMAEHVALAGLWDAFLLEDNCENAKNVFKKFMEYSKRHLELEDTILFPLFNKSLGLEIGAGPIQVTDYEHKNMSKMLDQIDALLNAGDFAKALSLGAHFKSALSKHQEKETERQYSLLSSFVSISPKDWGEMLSGNYHRKNKRGVLIFSKQKMGSLLRAARRAVRKFLERARSHK